MTTAPDDPGSSVGGGHWVLDGERSSVTFRSTSLWGLIRVKGRFTAARGEAQAALDGAASGQLVVDAASVETGNKKRDTHLRSADFFDVAAHPEVTYEVSQATLTGTDSVRLVGVLSVAGQRRPLELDATLSERDDTGLTIVAATTVDRSQFGLSWKKMGMTKMATPVAITARFAPAG